MVPLALFACQPAETTETDDANGSVDYSGQVVWVTDGDTIVVELAGGRQVDVRLVGVNAPDSAECFYSEATSFLIELVKGADVGLDDLGLDQFGRTLAYVWSGTDFVNERLVSTGHAIATTPRDDETHGSDLIGAETAAFESGAGLWNAESCGVGALPAVSIDTSKSVFNPSGPDDEVLDQEVLVLVNSGSVAVELAGWTLRDESSRHRFRFGNDALIQPGGRIMIASSDPRWDPGSTPVWNNGGDMALLLDRSGRVVDRWRY